MFFYKKHKHRHKNNKERCINMSGNLKVKKRFGLTPTEMNDLLFQMIDKPKIPIMDVK